MEGGHREEESERGEKAETKERKRPLLYATKNDRDNKAPRHATSMHRPLYTLRTHRCERNSRASPAAPAPTCTNQYTGLSPPAAWSCHEKLSTTWVR